MIEIHDLQNVYAVNAIEQSLETGQTRMVLIRSSEMGRGYTVPINVLEPSHKIDFDNAGWLYHHGGRYHKAVIGPDGGASWTPPPAERAFSGDDLIAALQALPPAQRALRVAVVMGSESFPEPVKKVEVAGQHLVLEGWPDVHDDMPHPSGSDQ